MNMNALMQQAQKMKKDMETKQKEIESSTFEGNSELVDIILYGSKKVKSVKIKKSSLDEEDVEILEDMIKIAMNEALNKIEKTTEEKMGVYAKQFGGLM
jgi:DNA-binding YbaB/EbfC family protein